METKQCDSVFRVVFCHWGMGCWDIQQRHSEKLTHKIFKCGKAKALFSVWGGAEGACACMRMSACACMYWPEKKIQECLRKPCLFRGCCSSAEAALLCVCSLDTHTHTSPAFHHLPALFKDHSWTRKSFVVLFEQKLSNNMSNCSWMTDDK